MTLVQLRHLLSLAQTGSFSKSATALFLTQPALSRSIRALEAELGQPLFDRVGRRSEVTPFGREVLERARQLVGAADDLRESGAQMALGNAGTLRIGLGSGPGAMLMTPLLMHMATHHPRLRLEISRGRTDLLDRSLRERTIDALVVDARSLVPAPDLRATETYEMRGAFLCRRGHPLAAQARRRELRSAARVSDRVDAAERRGGARAGRALRARGAPGALRHAALRGDSEPGRADAAHRHGADRHPRRGRRPGELAMKPALNATARFALVTLAGRSEAPALPIVRRLMKEVFHDG